MKVFIRLGVINISVLGFTVAVALLVFNNQFFDFLGVTISENYVLNQIKADIGGLWILLGCLLYTSPSPRDNTTSRMPSSA